MFKKTKVGAAVALALNGLALTPLPALGQQQLERVEITGSSLRRVDAETALPVTIINVEDLARQGVTTAEQALSRIAANQSYQGISAGVGATTGGKSEADIRGLSGPTGGQSNKTLVLLNGRRLPNHAFDAASADLNAIPLSAIQRIEVLRDGASAIYGTDAIGGVINFILRRDYQGVEVTAETTRPRGDGGGRTNRANVTAGFGSLTESRFNVLATLDVRKQNVLEARDRRFADSGVLGPRRSDITNGTSGTSFPGDLNGFEPSGPACNPPSSIPRNTVEADNSGAFNSCRYDFSRDVDIVPENEQRTGLLRGSFAITPDHTISVEALHAKNESIQKVAPVPQNHLMPATSPFFPAGAPLSPAGIPDLNNPGGPNVPGGVANWRAIPGGKRISGSDTTNERYMLEGQGLLAGFDYRAAIGTARNKSEASVKSGYLDDDLIQAGVFNGTINPFPAVTPTGLTPQSAAGDAAIAAAQIDAPTLIGKNEINFADARITKDLFQLPAGPVAAAFGVERRNEKSSFVATDINVVLVNSLGIDPDSDTSGSRNVTAFFTEFGIPVVKNLDLTLALRHDRYSDFGNTTNPKFGIRFQPVRQVLLRGSYNEGFRAPTLYDIYAPPALTFTSDNYDDPVLCPGGVAVAPATPGVVCGQQVLERQAGPAGVGQPITSLRPEESKTYTVGVVLEPVQSLTVGIDYWRINIENLINALPEQTIFGDPVANASRFVRCSQLSGTPGPGITRDDVDVCLNFPTFDPIAFIDAPNQNLGELKTNGIDLSVNWRSPATAIGTFNVGYDGTYVRQYDYQRERNGPFIKAVGRYEDDGPVFRYQHVINLGLTTGAWALNLGQRHKGKYSDQGGDRFVGSYQLYDASVTFTGVKNLTVTAGILNLFDEDPPLSFQNNTFQRGYDPRFTDPLGRSLLFRIGYRFF